MSDDPLNLNVGALVVPKSDATYIEVANKSRMIPITPNGIYRIDEKKMGVSGVHIRISKKEDDGNFVPVQATLLLDSFQPAPQK